MLICLAQLRCQYFKLTTTARKSDIVHVYTHWLLKDNMSLEERKNFYVCVASESYNFGCVCLELLVEMAVYYVVCSESFCDPQIPN